MLLTDLWPKDARIIEVNATDGAVGNRLVESGYSGYLGVVVDGDGCRAIGERYPGLKGCLAISKSGQIVRKNNADVLILNQRSVLSLLRFRNVRHARYVAFELRPCVFCLFAILLGLLHWLLGRMARPQWVDVDCGRSNRDGRTAAARLLVFPVRRPRPPCGARRYIPHTLGIEGFLKQLQRQGARHTVLRWFESLPEVQAGEDLDLLVDDASLATVRAMLDGGPGVQPIDLYSVTGLPGSDFRDLPYYPPYLAEQLLDRAVDYRGLCRVPSPHDHFLSLAYHALYHKGEGSGIPARDSVNGRRPPADHDYPNMLCAMAEQLGIDVPITFESLDFYLDSHGWRPPHDMLVRLSQRNRRIRALLKQSADKGMDDRLAVFLLRQAAMERGGVERTVDLLQQHGFQVLATRSFHSELAVTVARSVRGGNWGQGPWPRSGGQPIAAIVTYDPSPVAPTRRQRRRYPHLANARLLCKEPIRDAFNEGHPAERHCNVIHSSDNGREAHDYLRIVAPDIAENVIQQVDRLTRGTSSPSASMAATCVSSPRRSAA